MLNVKFTFQMPVPSRPSLTKLSEILNGPESSTSAEDLLPYTDDEDRFLELDNQGSLYVKEIFTSSLFGGSRMSEQSITGVLVLLCIAFGIALILLMCYFLIKICNLQLPQGEKSNSMIDSKDKFRGRITLIPPFSKYPDLEIPPSKVLYPKRIYEIQAEEGYFSCPPSIQQSVEDISSKERKPSIFDPNYAGPLVKKCRDSIKLTGTSIKRKLTTTVSQPDLCPKERLRQIISANPDICK